MNKTLLFFVFCFGIFLGVGRLALGVDSIDQRARQIADQLRCPVCRGIPVSDSPSELAQNMTKTVREKLEQGESEEQILNYFVDRYGEWILLEPKPKGMNLTIWVLPLLILLGGGLFLIYTIMQWSRRKH
ncbi:MAG: cytochrome c-type biogenesis protein CcmH [Deltaproteobacteria bacterium]|nr:cytochrome c-type biogenesis protein CcmH [Deltaproteobacteria bacterium]